jgi:hypothetical protein
MGEDDHRVLSAVIRDRKLFTGKQRTDDSVSRLRYSLNVLKGGGDAA